MILILAVATLACQPRPIPPDPGLPWESAYPRIATYAPHNLRWADMTEAQKAQLCRSGMIIINEPPEVIAEIRERNPEALIAHSFMPQWSALTSTGDTDWKPSELIAHEAARNGWFLYTVDQNPIATWPPRWHILNWTRHCPRSSDGLTAQDFVGRHLIPRLRAFDYDVIILEVVAETIWRGWLRGHQHEIDLDRDGRADPIEEVNAEFAEATRRFLVDFRQTVGPDVQIIVGGDSFAPASPLVDGILIEDALHRNVPRWTWPHEFYQTPPGRRGLIWARTFYGTESHTIFEVLTNETDGPAEPMNRRIRLAMGTALLTDAWFCVRLPRWDLPPGQPPIDPWYEEFDLKLGRYGAPIEKIIIEADTLYRRRFFSSEAHYQVRPTDWTGQVRVNPSGHELAGVPPYDAEIRSASP
ncbi:MAG: hypothetical protein GWN89_04135 [Thermoplasmata archaeon]|nr:hypothetical protein [Thermoplasmata archaeon]